MVSHWSRGQDESTETNTFRFDGLGTVKMQGGEKENPTHAEYTLEANGRLQIGDLIGQVKTDANLIVLVKAGSKETALLIGIKAGGKARVPSEEYEVLDLDHGVFFGTSACDEDGVCKLTMTDKEGQPTTEVLKISAIPGGVIEARGREGAITEDGDFLALGHQGLRLFIRQR